MKTLHHIAVQFRFTVAVIAGASLVYQPRLSVTTLTTYGWTAQSAPTGYISC